MIGYVRHLPRQLPVVAAFGRAMLGGRRPSAEAARTIAPISPVLVRDYVEHVGGDPAAYRRTIPAHLFPHWGLALAARTLAGLRYPLARVINAGCRLEVTAPLPSATPLIATARLVSVDATAGRVVLVQRLTTGTADVPEAVVATIRAIVPLEKRAPRERTPIPYDAHELARWSLARDAGLAFALLTGDFNPIHYSAHAAGAAGFPGPILHGFSMLARTIEGVVRARFCGDASRVRVWDATFTRPLPLPGEVALFANGQRAWLGDAPGGAPYLAMELA